MRVAQGVAPAEEETMTETASPASGHHRNSTALHFDSLNLAAHTNKADIANTKESHNIASEGLLRMIATSASLAISSCLQAQ